MGALATVPESREVSEVGSVLQAIVRAASDPSVNIQTLRELFSMQKEMLQMQAEVQFNQDMKSAQQEMEPVLRDAKGDKGTRYARLESIDAKIRPIYTKYGFSLTFNSGEAKAAGAVRVLCDVRHVGGHVKAYELEGDLDTTGAKGASNKTGIQGLGSSVSYLRRYLTIMIFNIALVGEDNDGQRTKSQLTEDQQRNLDNMVSALELKDNGLRGLLSLAGVSRIELMQPCQYEPVMDLLRKKLEGKRKREAGE